MSSSQIYLLLPSLRRKLKKLLEGYPQLYFLWSWPFRYSQLFSQSIENFQVRSLFFILFQAVRTGFQPAAIIQEMAAFTRIETGRQKKVAQLAQPA